MSLESEIKETPYDTRNVALLPTNSQGETIVDDGWAGRLMRRATLGQSAQHKSKWGIKNLPTELVTGYQICRDLFECQALKSDCILQGAHHQIPEQPDCNDRLFSLSTRNFVETSTSHLVSCICTLSTRAYPTLECRKHTSGIDPTGQGIRRTACRLVVSDELENLIRLPLTSNQVFSVNPRNWSSIIHMCPFDCDFGKRCTHSSESDGKIVGKRSCGVPRIL